MPPPDPRLAGHTTTVTGSLHDASRTVRANARPRAPHDNAHCACLPVREALRVWDTFARKGRLPSKLAKEVRPHSPTDSLSDPTRSRAASTGHPCQVAVTHRSWESIAQRSQGSLAMGPLEKKPSQLRGFCKEHIIFRHDANAWTREHVGMADDDAVDSQALTGGDTTRCRALLSQDRPDVRRVGRCLVGKPRAKCRFRWQQSGDLDAYSDADFGGDRATRRSVSAGVIMRGSHCLKVWTEKQQVVALSSAESGLYAAVKMASELGEGPGDCTQTEFAPGCLSDDVPGQSEGTGQGEARRHAESVDTGGIQVRPVRHEEGRHEREPRRLDDETAGKAEDRAAHGRHGLRIHENRDKSVEVSIGENMMVLQIAALAVGYARWNGGIRVPMNSLKCKFCKCSVLVEVETCWSRNV